MPYKNRRESEREAYLARGGMRESARRWQKRRRAEQRALIDAAKARPCVDCGQTYPPYVMDFDHVRGEKLYEINRFGRAIYSAAVIAAEIAKCEVVCANCHRIRTHGGRLDKAV